MLTSAPAGISRRDRLIISACLGLVIVLAWSYLLVLDRRMASSADYAAMMARMGMAIDAPWTAVDLLLTLAMWTVMMVGMMAPAAAPVLLLFAAAVAGRRAAGVPRLVLTFGAGYMLVWAGFSACATAAQWGLHAAAMLSPTMRASSPRLGAVILMAAGAYQLTPFKSACLTQCRSPLGFLMTRWRDGAIGALRMGISHGIYCLGCCWALMCVLFVVGVMNLVWVAILAIFVLVEKTGPSGTLVARLGGVAMIVAAALFAAVSR